MSTRKRILIVDEITDSCRLMPTWVQSMFMGIMIGIGTLIVPIISYFFSILIIVVQLIFIVLLTKKNIVYRKISRIEMAIEKKIIWVESKRDKNEKKKKIMLNLLLFAIVVVLFYIISDLKLLIINSLFCLLFILKVIFYVPLVSVRITKDDNEIGTFLFVDKGTRINTEIYAHQINSVVVNFDGIEIITKKDKIELPLDFTSGNEVLRKEYCNEK